MDAGVHQEANITAACLCRLSTNCILVCEWKGKRTQTTKIILREDKWGSWHSMMSRLTIKLQKCGMRQAGSSVEQIKQNNPEIRSYTKRIIWSYTKRINWLVGWFFSCLFISLWYFFPQRNKDNRVKYADRNGHLHIKGESRQTAHFIKINSSCKMSREITEGETYSTLTSAKNGYTNEGVNSEITSLEFSTPQWHCWEDRKSQTGRKCFQSMHLVLLQYTNKQKTLKISTTWEKCTEAFPHTWLEKTTAVTSCIKAHIPHQVPPGKHKHGYWMAHSKDTDHMMWETMGYRTLVCYWRHKTEAVTSAGSLASHKTKHTPSMLFQNSGLHYLPTELKTYIPNQTLYIGVYSGVTLNCQDLEAKRCPSVDEQKHKLQHIWTMDYLGSKKQSMRSWGDMEEP